MGREDDVGAPRCEAEEEGGELGSSLCEGRLVFWLESAHGDSSTSMVLRGGADTEQRHELLQSVD